MLNFIGKTSCGIDISDDRISVAILKQQNDEIKLHKAFDGPVPKGAVIDGNITDPAMLGQAIRRLLKKNKSRVSRATISLVASPVLTQIIELPKEMPANIGQFIQSEIRHSAFLAGKDSHYDYCGLGDGGPESIERVFVGATETDKIMAIVKSASAADIEVEAIEPPVISAARALYSKKIAGTYDSNVLVAFIHGSVLSICVFRNTSLGFVRCIDIGGSINDSEDSIARCTEEFNAVIQYYDVEVDDSRSDKWEIIVASDDAGADAGDLEFFLQKKLGRPVTIYPPSAIYNITSLAENPSVDSASIFAIGLAMRSFENSGLHVNINMMPPTAEEAKVNKKLVLLTANLAAVVVLVMLLATGIINYRLGKAQAFMAQQSNDDSGDNIENLLNKQRAVNEQIASLSGQRSGMGMIYDSDSTGKWADILDDIRKKTPKALDIRQMRSDGGSNLEMRGSSLKFKSIYQFAELLGESDFIASAAVAETNKDNHIQNIVSYVIKCELVNKEEPQTDVDG